MSQETDRRFLIIGDPTSGELVGVDVSSGQPAWRTALGRGDFDFAISGPYIVVVSVLGSAVHCIDYTSGRVLWKAETTAKHSHPQIVIDGPRVFIARFGHVDCFGGDGTRYWSYKLHGAPKSIAFGFPGNVRPTDHS